MFIHLRKLAIFRGYEVSQGRREPNVISGSVKAKIDGENAAVWSKKRCDLQKKKVLRENFNGFSGRN